MSPVTRRTRLGIAAVAALAACLAAAAAALADYVIFSDGFSTRHGARQLESTGGKHCDRGWNANTKTLGITVKRGPEVCGVRPPVQSDSHLPDHSFSAVERITKETRRSVRDGAFVGLDVRDSASSGYELRVFPKSHEFRLSRDPAGGPFPVTGSDPAINGIDSRNQLELRAWGDTVRAFVNGKKVAEVTDPSPGDVGGRGVVAFVGNTDSSKRDTVAVLDDLVLACPKTGC